MHLGCIWIHVRICFVPLFCVVVQGWTLLISQSIGIAVCLQFKFGDFGQT